jgi:hypothetical protein
LASKSQAGEFGDMIAMRILDPTKVIRSALQNAAPLGRCAATRAALQRTHEKLGAGTHSKFLPLGASLAATVEDFS